MNSPWIKWIIEKWQSMGPLILVELILPGGSILAFMLWLYKNKRVKNAFSLQVEKVKVIAENNLTKCSTCK